MRTFIKLIILCLSFCHCTYDLPPLNFTDSVITSSTKDIGLDQFISKPDIQQIIPDSMVALPRSCAEAKQHNPSLGDGVLTLALDGKNASRAYCDMTNLKVLCTSQEEEHEGKTREGSNLIFRLKSKLLPDEITCEIWAVRTQSNDTPFTKLKPLKGQTLSTCQAFGFIRDNTINACPYGQIKGYSDCGFKKAEYYYYSNSCTDCDEGGGEFPNYTRQGPLYMGAIISDFDGTIRSSCRAVK